MAVPVMGIRLYTIYDHPFPFSGEKNRKNTQTHSTFPINCGTKRCCKYIPLCVLLFLYAIMLRKNIPRID